MNDNQWESAVDGLFDSQDRESTVELPPDDDETKPLVEEYC